MMLAWHWPWAALAGVLATLAIIVLIVVFARRNAADDTPVCLLYTSDAADEL